MFDALVGAGDGHGIGVAGLACHPVDGDQNADAARGHHADLREVEDDPVELPECLGLKQIFPSLQTFEVVGGIIAEVPFKLDHENIAPCFQRVPHVVGHCSHHLGGLRVKGASFFVPFRALLR